MSERKRMWLRLRDPQGERYPIPGVVFVIFTLVLWLFVLYAGGAFVS